ncbi:MAG: hypothetical protein M3296_04385, partial [Actinomycetota bacterium]|nr:hypothetical protein [Actinomycetota bacterium]
PRAGVPGEPAEPRRAQLLMDAERVEELRAEARHHRQRYDLYRAKAYGQRPTSPVRLRELERIAQAAEERLANAERALQHRRAGDGPA